MSSGELVWFQLIYGKFFPVNEINLLVWNPVFSYPAMWFACEELVLNSVQKFKGMTDNLSPKQDWTCGRANVVFEIWKYSYEYRLDYRQIRKHQTECLGRSTVINFHHK